MDERSYVVRSYALTAKFMPVSGHGAAQSQVRVFPMQGRELRIRDVVVLGIIATDTKFQADVLWSFNGDATPATAAGDQSVFVGTAVGTSLTADDAGPGVLVVNGATRFVVDRRIGPGVESIKVRVFTVSAGAADGTVCVVVSVDELGERAPGDRLGMQPAGVREVV